MNVIEVSPDGGLATLAAALLAIRRLPEGEPKRIVVKSGRYYDTAVTLEPRDAGLTIAAAPGAHPIFYGGRQITGWQPDGTNAFSVALPGVREGHWDFRALIVNGQLRPRARLPRTGAFEHLNHFDVNWMSTTGGGWKRKPTEQEMRDLMRQLDEVWRGAWRPTRRPRRPRTRGRGIACSSP